MLSEEVIKLMGQTGDITVMEVERGDIKKYANAIGDSNTLYLDEEYAKNSRYGSIIAPLGFFGWPVKWTGNSPMVTKLLEKLLSTLTQAGYGRYLDGGVEYEFFSPVRAGDILAALPKIISISERETKSGKLVFSVMETTYTNQSGNLVAKARRTWIHR